MRSKVNVVDIDHLHSHLHTSFGIMTHKHLYTHTHTHRVRGGREGDRGGVRGWERGRQGDRGGSGEREMKSKGCSACSCQSTHDTA